MESGNFTFMHKAEQPKHQEYKYSAEYKNTPLKKSVLSSHSPNPADNVRKGTTNQPHSSVHNKTTDDKIEIIGVTHLQEASHNVVNDINEDTVSSDSETEYEEVDSNYTESSADDDEENDIVANGSVPA